ncbi:prepilin-type N-terminal cleavage/methylation domain-containing protein [Halobacillus yeomjeoni]|uniref:type IV pilus modification PilV family protein n=1 Tax=Halobacillus yeomjeoni TaxID=311194 RepID=UPI001CD51887|nr:prepilin-type N-terminal cleavage/methylation domain-containing protein [Halobacillus yeomjeoni]MCA0982589.1 prepilin-type N-terminal cleavage/methylation domain-containing protein [Halobacillus yeomjeoni]
MTKWKEEEGFSLVEVLVAMALLTITFIVSVHLVMNTVTQTTKINRSFSSVELADSILDAYQTMPSDEVKQGLNQTKSIDIASTLGLDADDRLTKYSAQVTVTEPATIELKEHLLKVEIIVESENLKDEPVELEGYVEL